MPPQANKSKTKIPLKISDFFMESPPDGSDLAAEFPSFVRGCTPVPDEDSTFGLVRE
jgi:hypothetical protein